MDAFIILVLVIIIICWACYRRKLSTAAYGIAALDIFLRIIDFISRHIGHNEISRFLGNFPNSILSVTDHYTNGTVYLILAWSFVILMIYFLVLTIISFIKK